MEDIFPSFIVKLNTKKLYSPVFEMKLFCIFLKKRKSLLIYSIIILLTVLISDNSLFQSNVCDLLIQFIVYS